jgi:outer membrane protein assembly factor BamA
MRPRALPFAIGAIGLLVGCAHGRAHRPGEEQLKAIKFEGNQQMKSGDLTDGLALHRVELRGGAPDPYLVQIDADRIRGEYLRRGYLDIGVRSRVERKGDDATVIYTLEEGKRAATQVVITGLPDDVPVASVRDKLPLEDGKPFDYEAYDEAKPMLLGVVQDAGYAHATLDSRVIADRANHTAVVDLTYTPGPKCTFGNVEIAGVSGELAQAVRDRLAFAPGQVYSTQAIAQTQRNLYGFGRFSTVRVAPEQGAAEVVGVKVAVSESAPHQVQLGGGFGYDPSGYSVRGRAGYSIAGWPFPLDTVSLEVRPEYAYEPNAEGSGTYQPRVRAIARFERADLFWPYTKANVDVGYNYLTVEAYTSYGPLARLGFETPLGTDKVKLRVGWSIEQVSFRSITNLIDPPTNIADSDAEGQSEAASRKALEHRLGLDQSERNAGLLQALVVDLRDHPLEPRFGAYGELRTIEGGAYAGGAFNYFETTGDARGYLPLPGRIVIAGRARFGGIWGDVPATERFFSGGAISQRGFGERRLAPFTKAHPYVLAKDMAGNLILDANGKPTSQLDPMNFAAAPYGGAGLIETSLEARVPVTTIRSMPIGFVTFLDGGDVTDAPGDLNVMDLHWAVGGGLRVMTPIGPARLDVGYRLNRRHGPLDPDHGQLFAYHLTVGEAF